MSTAQVPASVVVPALSEHDDWVTHAARVWHGFTQMSTYADNAPIIVERAEGHELIDVDGRRYLDAISSLWVTTLGHRVPELDDAAARPARPRRPLHDARQRQPRRRSSWPRRWRAVVPVDDPHFLFASDGAAAVEQALKIAFQFWTNQGVAGRTTLPRVRRRLPRRHHRRALGRATAGSAPTCSTRCASRCCGRPTSPTRAASRPRSAMVAAHAAELAAVVVEPLVQGAAGMQLAEPDGLAALGAACREHDVLLICDEVATGFGRTGTLFAIGAVRRAARPARARQGHHRRVPADVGHGGQRPGVRRVPRPRPLASGRSTTGTPTAGTRSAAAVALRHLELLDEWDVLANVRARSDELRGLLDERIAPLAGGGRGPPAAGSWAASSWRRRADGLRWGRRVCAAAVRARACCCARSATWSCSCRRSPSPRTRSTASSTRSRPRIDEVADGVSTWRRLGRRPRPTRRARGRPVAGAA